MTRYLVDVAVGPVQEFIANARRTRDLWFGSHILSELSKAIARHLAGCGFTLVFPALDWGDAELEPCEGLYREATGVPALAVSNVILALSPDVDSLAVRNEVAKARAGALELWRAVFATHAARELAPLLRPCGAERVTAALDDVLECTAAWVPLADADDGTAVREARSRLAALVAGRKNLRDFSSWNGREGLPKSSLDGFRETVFRDDLRGDIEAIPDRERVLAVARRYRIPLTEHLDGIGVVKRAGGTPTQFIRLARVALADWIEKVAGAEPARFDVMTKELEAIIERTTLARVSGVPGEWVGLFPYDAEVFLDDQWKNHTLLKRPRGRALATVAVNEEAAREYEAFVEARVRPLLCGRTPDPYVACVVADGDRMGEALERCSAVQGLRSVSKGLGSFAQDARRVVVEHHGSLVYAGGDDVLAFLPVTQALDAAASLAEAFSKRMRESFPPADAGDRPTLSVGIAIGHVLVPMGELLQLGRDAESLAKRGDAEALVPYGEQRNALAILSERRGGGRVWLRERWAKDDAGLVDPGRTARALGNRIRTFLDGDERHGLAYEVRQLLARCPQPEALPGQSHELWAELVSTELRGLLVRKRFPGAAANDPSALDDVWRRLGLDLAAVLSSRSGSVMSTYEALHRRAYRWTDEALVIRHLGLAWRAVEKASGKAP